jgi:3-deoxy-D-manno-octulosonic-acid transferase
MLLAIIYDLILVFLAIIASPFVLYRLVFKKKYRSSFWQRIGFGFPVIHKGSRPLIWIHAVSLGETKAVANLAKLIKEEWDNPIILISSVTETGHAEAKRNLPFADYHVYLPLDFGSLIGPIVNRVAPDYVILTESDFWLNFLKSAKSTGANIALVNGKISHRSFERFKKIHWFQKTLFSYIDLFCTQTDLYATRFKALGIPNEKIIVTGNLKYDETDDFLPTAVLQDWKNKLKISDDELILVLGSTHDPEEKMIFNVLKDIWKLIPNLTVIIAPRHPERFQEVERIIHQLQIPLSIYSKIEKRQGNEPVILIDGMGLLRKCYQIADIALVAGSYTQKVGGHSIIEPSHYGIPVIYGPFMQTQSDMVELLRTYNAGLQVPLEGLYSTLMLLLTEPEERKKIGEAGTRMMKELHGITKKTEKSLRKIRHLEYVSSIN